MRLLWLLAMMRLLWVLSRNMSGRTIWKYVRTEAAPSVVLFLVLGCIGVWLIPLFGGE
jgi:hypothetical protein